MSLAPISPSACYELSNNFLGPEYRLKVKTFDAGSAYLHVDNQTHATFEQWLFIQTWGSHKYHICTMCSGEFMCLSITQGVKSLPVLRKPKYDASDFWYIQTWPDGTSRIMNDYSGEDLHLDVYSDTYDAFMGDGDHTGQHWSLSKVSSLEKSCPRSLVSSSYRHNIGSSWA